VAAAATTKTTQRSRPSVRSGCDSDGRHLLEGRNRKVGKEEAAVEEKKRG
jgi:hypothetical protein